MNLKNTFGLTFGLASLALYATMLLPWFMHPRTN